ncbi:MAG: DUF4857 domain-containing protein [Calditrichaceae bacterium]|nr:DUF4857 domain-containing protein [Calditrichaceae bacterium]MBN2708391.1 DUF4857 domain-containing protein [Calditrichaceae bacterium]
MLLKLSRFLLIISTILVLAVFLPYYYWIAFDKHIFIPNISYSNLEQEFFILRQNGIGYKWFDESGRELTNGQADSLMPLNNFAILIAKNKMPAHIRGIPINLEDVRNYRYIIRYRPDMLDDPVIPLYCLFESNPARIDLELPEDMFRINDRIEFINTRTNKINPDKSELFTCALINEHFNFPAKKVFGNSNSRKPYDEGYFIIDNNKQVFHLKMINGEAFCKHISAMDSIDIQYIVTSEPLNREFYGVAITNTNSIYFVLRDNYTLKKISIRHFNKEKNQIIIRGNLLNHLITIQSTNNLQCIVLDRKYNRIDEYQESWQTNDDFWTGKLEKYLFPFIIRLEDPDSSLINLYFSNYHWQSLYLNLLLTGLFFICSFLRKRSFKDWPGIITILICGIYGFIALKIFSRE